MSSNLSETIKKVLSDEQNVREASAPFVADFPFDRDQEAQVTRREFCNFLFLTSSAFMLSTAAFAGKSAYDARSATTLYPARIAGSMELEPGNALNFAYPGKEDSAILIRSAEGTYHAFGQKCTHLSCPVHYSKKNDRLECPCHEGGFDARTGNVLYGPPPRPLDMIEIEVHNGEVFATGRKVRGNEG